MYVNKGSLPAEWGCRARSLQEESVHWQRLRTSSQQTPSCSKRMLLGALFATLSRAKGQFHAAHAPQNVRPLQKGSHLGSLQSLVVTLDLLTHRNQMKKTTTQSPQPVPQLELWFCCFSCGCWSAAPISSAELISR